MTVRLTIEVPEDAFSALRATPEDFAREMKLSAAIKWYEMGRISQAKAAGLAGLSRHDFLLALDRYGVSPFQTTPEELRQEAIRA